MIIGGKPFDFDNDCYIMGILNVTPDSFSDGGQWNDLDAALHHVEDMVHEGAAIIDVGGESTRPGYTRLECAEEIDRVVPAIEAIKARFDIPLSVDTYKSEVLRAALEAGADALNDIWGLKADENMAAVAAEYNIPVMLMHNREEAVYDDFIPDFLNDLRESLDIAHRNGIQEENIILDPGVGFGKNLEQNLTITNRLECMKELGYPILLATSRKSMIGLSLGLPKEERLEGTIATTVMGVMKGASLFRVHDVKENYRAMRMAQAILREHK